MLMLAAIALSIPVVNARDVSPYTNSSANSSSTGTSNQVLLFQRHLSNPKCCYGHYGHNGDGPKKIEKGLAWTCNGCNCKDLADRELSWSTSHCNRHSWTEFQAKKLCVRRFNRDRDPEGNGFVIKFRITLWDGGREIIPFTDWEALTSESGHCIDPQQFLIGEAVTGDRLKIELRGAKWIGDRDYNFEGWGQKQVKKSTRSFKGSFVYNSDAGQVTLTCYPNYAHVKHPDCSATSPR